MSNLITRSFQLFTVLLVMMSCDKPTSHFSENDREAKLQLKNAAWLIGTWQMSTSSDTTYETWRKDSDTLFLGVSFSVTDGDTVIHEAVKIVERDHNVDYIPTVTGQNDGLPVAFRLTYIDSLKMVFENQAHDFPQTITYLEISSDSLVAEISGTVKGEYRSKKFPMKRIP